jgi:hypothetical protein
MSRPHKLQIKMLESVHPITYAGGKQGLEIEVVCGEQQQRAIALDMIGRMPSEEAYTWARAEFPEWFKAEEKTA